MNKQALFDKMAEQGISIKEMYSALKMSRSAFYRKCNGISEFTLKEIKLIMSLLGVDDPNEIFFSKEVSKTTPQLAEMRENKEVSGFD